MVSIRRVQETERLLASIWRERDMPPGAQPAPGGCAWGDDTRMWGWSPLHTPWTVGNTPQTLKWGKRDLVRFIAVWHPADQNLEWETDPPTWVDLDFQTKRRNRLERKFFDLHAPLRETLVGTLSDKSPHSRDETTSYVDQAYIEMLNRFTSLERPSTTWANAWWTRAVQLVGRSVSESELIPVSQRTTAAQRIISRLEMLPNPPPRNPEHYFRAWIELELPPGEDRDLAMKQQSYKALSVTHFEMAVESVKTVSLDIPITPGSQMTRNDLVASPVDVESLVIGDPETEALISDLDGIAPIKAEAIRVRFGFVGHHQPGPDGLIPYKLVARTIGTSPSAARTLIAEAISELFERGTERDIHGVLERLRYASS